MTARIIPIANQLVKNLAADLAMQPFPATGLLSDTLARPLRDLRISVTDRCNFRCSYCMPSEVFNKDYAFLPQTSLLSFEEIARLARIFVAHGVEKIRITGGEPLLRKNLEVLIEMLARMTTVAGKPLDITLTTNASLLAKKAQSLKDAGLQRVTVSLDAMDDTIFRRMNDVDFPVADVLRGIEVANQVGLLPIKINMVVKRGTNDQEIVPIVKEGALSIFQENNGQCYRFIIKNPLQFSLVVDYLSIGVPFRMAISILLRTKKHTGLANIGSISKKSEVLFCVCLCT